MAKKSIYEEIKESKAFEKRVKKRSTQFMFNPESPIRAMVDESVRNLLVEAEGEEFVVLTDNGVEINRELLSTKIKFNTYFSSLKSVATLAKTMGAIVENVFKEGTEKGLFKTNDVGIFVRSLVETLAVVEHDVNREAEEDVYMETQDALKELKDKKK